MKIVNCLNVKISTNVTLLPTLPEPKFNPGITPMITHEVGFLTDGVTFSSKIKKPKCAMLAVSQYGRPWIETDATIAFPNDMPLTLRLRETDLTAKTIFKGLDRYIPPVDESLTYTLDQLLQKKAHDNWFLEYIRGTAAVSNMKERCSKPRLMKSEPYVPLMIEEKSTTIPRDVLVPLTLVQLYRIRVTPTLITFGSVTTSKNCTQLLTVKNNNNFQISVKIIPLTSEIHIQTLESFLIQPNSETKVMLTFHKDTMGRYNGTITCVINGHHSFDIPVLAEVVGKSLTLDVDRIDFKFPEAPFVASFVHVAVHNPLNTPVSFNWSVQDGSPVKIEPIHGVTPMKGMVWCAAYFEPDNPNYKLHPLELLVEEAVCRKLKCGITLFKPNVYFLEPILNIGHLPLKLTTVKRFIVFNPDFCDTMFVILNKEPVKGIQVEPSSGMIKARGCFTLTLNISITTVGPLEFVVYINIQNSVTIELKVIGNIVYPQVEIFPKYISLTRVPCNSITKTTLTVENKSKARAEVCFEMEEYPQFKVSLSKRCNDLGISKKGYNLEAGSTQKFYLHFMPRDLASYDFYLPVVLNDSIGIYSSSPIREIEAYTKKVKSTYRSGSILDSSQKVFNAPKLKATMSHFVLIDVVVVKPQLVFSGTEFFFNSISQSKCITTTNTSNEPINIVFRYEETQSAFSFNCSYGQVVKERASLRLTAMPEEIVEFTVVFNATTPGNYITDVTVMVVTAEHSSTYSTIRLNGTINPSCVMNASVSNIYFTPVPLEVDTSYVFQLTVNTENQPEGTVISYEISNPHAKLFSVEFPKGTSVLGNCKTVMPIKFTFNSFFPVSIQKLITFRGNKDGECSLNVFATADNCLLTTHTYLKFHLTTQEKLKEYEDSIDKTDSDLLISTDKNNLQLKQLVGADALLDRGSSSNSSTMSRSLHTSPSIIGTGSVRNSKKSPSLKVSFQKRDSAMYHNRTNSDLDLSLQLNYEEGKPVNEKEPMLNEVVIKDGEKLIYPKFPAETSITEYAVHMRSTCYAVQQWVYEQVFNCSYYPIFGSHTFSTFSYNKKQYGRGTPVAMRNVFDALERICGRRVRRYFTPLDKLPEDNIARVMFTHNVYKQLLDFMTAQGALLSHVVPEYLMGYDDFCIYCKTVPSATRFFDTSISSSENFNLEEPSHDSFRSLSVQCWLDVFIQIFKTLFLGPAVGMKVGVLDQEVTKRLTFFHHEASFKKTIYSRAEEILMSWLTYYYNTQRSLIWPQETPATRTVTNFDLDLEDGLVLTAVTAAYCPYLVSLYFRNMFLQPVTVSQGHHNTVCLTTAWDRIKLGFSVTPRDFMKPNTVKMLMLVAHLYKILPTYKPEATVKFMATLNSSETQLVSLENAEGSAITYHIEVLPNTANFILDDCKDLFVLKGKQKGCITVRYTARNTAKAEATLLLCGACMPPKFGRNYVFSLEGNPVKLPVSSVFKVISPLNTACTTHIIVETPHNLDQRSDSINYDIWITNTEPQPGNLNVFNWSKERNRKIPRRLFILSEKLIVETNKKQKTGQLLMKISCFSMAVHHYWLLFTNSEIGDFIVKLQISPIPPEPSSTLTALLDSNNLCPCESKKSISCSSSISLNVPCRNLDQWSALRTMFELTISAAEKEFWGTYIESNVGFRLLQWMLQEKKESLDEEIELLFKKSKTYKVVCKSPHVSCVPSIHIPNVRSRISLPIKLHFDQNTTSHTTVLTLTSLDGEEIRSYNLKIICNY